MDKNVNHLLDTFDDRCHIKIYNHQPRNNRQIKLSQRHGEL